MFSKHCDLRVLTQQFLTTAAALVIAAAVVGMAPARGSAGYYAVDVVVTGQIYEDVIRQAEQQARAAILNHFRTHPGLNEVRVDVLGHRGGQVVPILSTQVSRQQWQTSPQIENWTRYYSQFHALLNHGGTAESGEASAVSSPPRQPATRSSNDPAVQLDEVAEDGQITDSEYIQLRDSLD